MKNISINNIDNIAVIGMSCKFPGANNIEKLWENLKNSKESISQFSVNQLMAAGVSEELFSQVNYKPYRGIIDEIELINKPVFKNTANDFYLLGLQAKVMSHLTHEALSKVNIKTIKGIKNTSVFIGTNSQLSSRHLCNFFLYGMDTGKLKDRYFSRTVAPYIAYQFGFHGAAVDLYTACSSSSVAVIQACRELKLNNCDLAIAGAVSIEFPQEFGYFYEDSGVFSSDGHCRPFDRAASGSLFSNGAGVVILKRLEDAVADGDIIHAVIVGHAMNNDGNQKTGFLAPGINGQYNCIRKAWMNANVNANEIDYIEAHGSATQLGDAIEIFALKKVFQELNAKNALCPIGSIKSNIGHTTVASGIASIIKTILMLKNKMLVPSINYNQSNSNIVFDDNFKLYVSTNYEPFNTQKREIHAGVSNFGLGGTNTHIVLKNFAE